MARPAEGVERPPYRTILAANVWALRNARGWSMERLAHESGTSKETVRVVEVGRKGLARDVYLDTIVKFAQALGVEPSKLLEFDEVATRRYLNGQRDRPLTVVEGLGQRIGGSGDLPIMVPLG